MVERTKDKRPTSYAQRKIATTVVRVVISNCLYSKNDDMNEKKEKRTRKSMGRTRSYSTTRRVVGRHISARNGTSMMRAQPMMKELPTSLSSPSIHVL